MGLTITKETPYHGAKNSTKMSGSGSTEDANVAAVKLKTSEASSATTKAARTRSDAGEMREENRITLGAM
jgi:hypothetical protein